MKINHPALADLLQMAYSAEKAAAFAYIGHYNSLKEPTIKAAVKQIELDEWNHRAEVKTLMDLYEVPVSAYYEIKFHIIGKIIALSCHLIGWFMPIYFAGRLESGNVCEYFRMMHYFHELGIRTHDTVLYDMGIKEKEHEDFFQEQIKDSRLLPFFSKIFSWGPNRSFNDVILREKLPVNESGKYCKK